MTSVRPLIPMALALLLIQAPAACLAQADGPEPVVSLRQISTPVLEVLKHLFSQVKVPYKLTLAALFGQAEVPYRLHPLLQDAATHSRVHLVASNLPLREALNILLDSVRGLSEPPHYFVYRRVYYILPHIAEPDHPDRSVQLTCYHEPPAAWSPP